MSKSSQEQTPSGANGEPTVGLVVDAASQEVAKVYAKALLAAAETAGNAPAIVEQAEAIAGWLSGQTKFQAILASELLGDDEKQGIITRVFGSRCDKTLIDAMRVLSRRGRLGVLGPVLKELVRQFHESKGKVRVLVTAATPLAGEAVEKLAKSLRPLIEGDPVIEVSLDPELIGGVVVRVGDTVYDASVARQLERLESQMITRSVHEIQSRRDSFRNSGGN